MIHGYFEPFLRRWPLPMVLATITLPGITDDRRRLPFLIDTGAVFTMLHPSGATSRVGLTRAQIEQPQPWPVQTTRGISGMTTNYAVQANYTFDHDDGSSTSFTGRILIARRTPANAVLPSIMGWDLLRQFHLTMDWETRTILLNPRHPPAVP